MSNPTNETQTAQKRYFCNCPLCNHSDWHLSNKNLFFKDYLMEKIGRIPFCPKAKLKFRAYTCDFCGNTILLSSKPYHSHHSLPVPIHCSKGRIFPWIAAFGTIGLITSFVVFKFSQHAFLGKISEMQQFFRKHVRIQ